jgi:hypothetical protein
MYYTVDNSGNSYEGLPNIDPESGTLTLPDGTPLAKGVGWKRVTINATGEQSSARQQLADNTRERARRRQEPPRDPARTIRPR